MASTAEGMDLSGEGMKFLREEWTFCGGIDFLRGK
jgi:hypothetical protein